MLGNVTMSSAAAGRLHDGVGVGGRTVAQVERSGSYRSRLLSISKHLFDPQPRFVLVQNEQISFYFYSYRSLKSCTAPRLQRSHTPRRAYAGASCSARSTRTRSQLIHTPSGPSCASCSQLSDNMRGSARGLRNEMRHQVAARSSRLDR